MVNFDEDDEEDEEWGHSLAATALLQMMASLLKDSILDEVVAFAGQRFAEGQQGNWKANYSGLVALGSILDGPDRGRMAPILMTSIANLLAMMQDPNQKTKIRETTAWVFSRIAEFHAEVLADQQNI